VDPPTPRIILSPGEPAGIGLDLCIQIAQSPWPAQLIVAADPRLLEERSRLLGLHLKLLSFDSEQVTPHSPGHLFVQEFNLPGEVRCGELDPGNAGYVLEILRDAVRGCVDGLYDALVTGPVQKSILNEAGFEFSGHTEYLAELTGTDTPVMLLTAGELRVALATTHLPLSQVSASLTTDGLLRSLKNLHCGLQRQFGIAAPRILVCGLNPHAGEQGHLGHEDEEVIAPAIEKLRTQGLDVVGPVPADTAFTPTHLRDTDAVMAMYHDQGLPVLKYAGFGRAVNVTLGLPIIRTSVDHGTALSLAGSGRADSGSLRSAISLATELVSRGASVRQ